MIVKEIKFERRSTTPTDEKFSTRATTDDKGNAVIEGYGILFNELSQVDIYERGRKFREVIEPTAFDNVLRNNPNVIMNINHDNNQPLARTKNGTLQLIKDEHGIKYRFQVPNTQLGKDTLELVKSGFYTESSFQYAVKEQGEDWKRDANNNLIHIVREGSGLFDMAIVDNGCFGTGGISVSERLAKRAIQLLDEDSTSGATGTTTTEQPSTIPGPEAVAVEPEVETPETEVEPDTDDLDIEREELELTIIKLTLPI